jgi:GWxTD domain-containing protein
MTDFDKAIRQLRYVATQREIDTIAAGGTSDERRSRFETFWRKLDPTPGTMQNEAFEEYFLRIDYANKNFRSYNEGWLTDMGSVYIVLGPPSMIESPTTTTMDMRSYRIWTYRNTNRRFIFIDEFGNGDFRLSPSTPFSPLEKFRFNG